MRPVTLVAAFLLCSLLPQGTQAEHAFTAEDRAWWAVQPVRDAGVPGDGLGHPVDAFVDRKLREAGLARAAPAGPDELLRRITFDLHGLPPAPEQVGSFRVAWRKDPLVAVEILVEELLASPRYGERWAQHWLDVVRFAESDGYREDAFRPDAWRYRDYVIHAFNEDKPYDEFVREQLAGDEIAPGDPERLIATGFLRHGIYEWNQRNAEMQRELMVDEITRVTGEVFLGLGIGCAQCHDHKFDPLLQRDYYALQAFLGSTCWPDDRRLGTPLELAAFHTQQAEWEEATADIRAEMDALLAEKRKSSAEVRIESFPAVVQAMYRKPREERSSYEQQIAMLVERQVNRDVRKEADPEKVLKKNKPEAYARYKELAKELAKFDRWKPEPLRRAFMATDTGAVAAKTIMTSGPKKTELGPGFPALLGLPAPEITPGDATTGRRRALAEWIASPENPFTSRVIVNRVWQHHFGRGLVATPNDFGTLGEPPTHPELLDWLASRFIEGGWKLKPLHRLIMTSESYRQTARREPGEAAQLADHRNTLLWRFPPQRLSAEQVRDAMLAVSGELRHRHGGPSVAGTAPHRSVFVKKFRNSPDAVLHCFDAPSGFDSAPERQRTTTPTQSLLLTNNEWPLARARAFAKRLLGNRKELDAAAIARAYRLAWGREATQDEIEAADKFLRGQAEHLATSAAREAAAKFAGETGVRPVGQLFGNATGIPLGTHALWVQPGSKFERLHVAGAGNEAQSFTVEAVVSLDRIHKDAKVNTIVSQWKGDPQGKGWAVGVTSEASRYDPRNFIVQLIGANPGGDTEYEVVASGLRVPLQRPVYLAAAIECLPNGQGTVRFAMKDLSDPKAKLQTAEVGHNIAGELVAKGGRFLIGGRDDDRGHFFDGQVARLAFSPGVVAPGDLLIAGDSERPLDLRFAAADGADPAPDSRWLKGKPAAPSTSPTLGAVTDFCHVLLSANEFLYLH